MTVTDPLTDPGLAEPRREVRHDPTKGHREFMERQGFQQWLEDAQARAFDRPIEEVRTDLEAREKAAAPRKPAAKKAAPAKKAAAKQSPKASPRA